MSKDTREQLTTVKKKGGFKRTYSSPEMLRSPSRRKTTQDEEDGTPDPFQLLMEKLNKMDKKMDLLASKEEVDELRRKVESLEKELQKSKNVKEQKDWELRLSSVENTLRGRNLIFRGLETAGDTPPSELVKQLSHEVLGVKDVHLTSAKIIKTKKSPLILASFISQETVWRILKEAHKLRGSVITIQRDLAPAARKLRSRMLALRRVIKGVRRDAEVRVRSGELVLGQLHVSWDEASSEYKCLKEGQDATTELSTYLDLDVQRTKRILAGDKVI